LTELPSSYKHIDIAAEQKRGRLVQHVVDMDKLDNASNSKLFANSPFSFCCFGTTRSVAGSAEAFRKIDFGTIKSIADLSKRAGVQYFSLVSSTGANPNSWFTYTKTKGEAEECVKRIGFPYTAIYRPGLIGRGGKARWVESILSWVSKPMPAETIARAMRLQAEHAADATPVGQQVTMLDNTGIIAAAKL